MPGKKISKFTHVWIEGYAVSSDMTSVTVANAWEEIEQGGFTEDKYYLNGRGEGSFSLDGLFNDTTDLGHDALKDITTRASKVITLAFGDNTTATVGDPTASMSTQQMSYEVAPSLDSIMPLTAAAKADTSQFVEWGVLLANATVTANGNQSSYDSGASSSNGGVGYLHITSLSAGDTITVKIQDSANDSTWADLITFTLDGTALDGERATVSGTVDRYIRAEYTVTGSSISFPIAVAFYRG